MYINGGIARYHYERYESTCRYAAALDHQTKVYSIT